MYAIKHVKNRIAKTILNITTSLEFILFPHFVNHYDYNIVKMGDFGNNKR